MRISRTFFIIDVTIANYIGWNVLWLYIFYMFKWICPCCSTAYIVLIYLQSNTKCMPSRVSIYNTAYYCTNVGCNVPWPKAATSQTRHFFQKNRWRSTQLKTTPKFLHQIAVQKKMLFCTSLNLTYLFSKSFLQVFRWLSKNDLFAKKQVCRSVS